MVEKLHAEFTKPEYKTGKGVVFYERPKGPQLEFTINHYAKPVKYSVGGPDVPSFLEKNRDTLAADVIACFRLSSNPLVQVT